MGLFSLHMEILFANHPRKVKVVLIGALASPSLSVYIVHLLHIHYGKLCICRVPTSLPCAISRAHGKKQLCRVSTNKHTANSWQCALLWHTAKPCVCCVLFLAHGKVLNLPCAFFITRQNNKKILLPP